MKRKTAIFHYAMAALFVLSILLMLQFPAVRKESEMTFELHRLSRYMLVYLPLFEILTGYMIAGIILHGGSLRLLPVTRRVLSVITAAFLILYFLCSISTLVNYHLNLLPQSFYTAVIDCLLIIYKKYSAIFPIAGMLSAILLADRKEPAGQDNP